MWDNTGLGENHHISIVKPDKKKVVCGFSGTRTVISEWCARIPILDDDNAIMTIMARLELTNLEATILGRCTEVALFL